MIVNSLDLKKKIIGYIIENGYRFPDTMNAFRRLYKRNAQSLSDCSDAELAQVNDWVEHYCNGATDYQRAVKSLWDLEDVAINDNLNDRHKDGIYYFFSAANIAINEQPERDRIAAEKQQAEIEKQNKINSADNKYGGEVGERVDVEVQEATVDGYIDIPVYPYNSYPRMKILGTNGIYYWWGNSKSIELERGDLISGKIKELRVAQDGTKMTVLTRAKITKKSERNNAVADLFSRIR